MPEPINPLNQFGVTSLGVSNDDYLRRRKNAIERLIKENEKFDKAIFVLATGPFILSATLLTGLKGVSFCCGYLLLLSWVFLILAIVLHIISYRINIKGELNEIAALDNSANHLFSKEAYRKISLGDKYSNISRHLNDICIASTISGITLLTLFVSINFMKINEENRHIPIPAKDPDYREGGYGVPPEPFRPDRSSPDSQNQSSGNEKGSPITER